MADETFFAFSPEIEQLFDKQGVDILSVLKSDGVDIRRQVVPAGDGSRDVALILLASSVTLASAGWAITKVLDALTRSKRRIVVRPVRRDALNSAEPDTAVLPAEVFQDQSRITASLDWHSGLRFELVSGSD